MASSNLIFARNPTRMQVFTTMTFRCIQITSYYAFSDHQQHLQRTLESAPDLYLDELRQDLEMHNGKSVSVSTIWKTLRKAGYTMKKVCHDTSTLLCLKGDFVILVL